MAAVPRTLGCSLLDKKDGEIILDISNNKNKRRISVSITSDAIECMEVQEIPSLVPAEPIIQETANLFDALTWFMEADK